MNFGSSFVLDRLSDCEDDEVIDQGRRLQYSDCEQDLFEADLEPPSPPPVASEAAQPARRARVLRRRALFDSSSSEDDSTGGVLGSLSSSPPSPPPSAVPDPFFLPQALAAPKVRKVHKATTNVVSVALSSLVDQAFMMTGDPEQCGGCGAYFSVVSFRQSSAEAETSSGTAAAADVEEVATATATGAALPVPADCAVVWKEGEPYPWECEFCGQRREINLEAEELPTAATVDYVLATPTAQAIADTAFDNNFVIFVIDTSGSICVSSPMKGGLKMKGL